MNSEIAMDIHLKIDVHIKTIRCFQNNYWKTIYAPYHSDLKIFHEIMIPDILILRMNKEMENEFKNQKKSPSLTWNVKLIDGKFEMIHPTTLLV